MAGLETAPLLRIREVELYEWPYRLRMPFRFGVITVTEGRQAVARLRIELADGRSAWGVAAEALAAKWFDKDPAVSDDDNVDQLRLALQIAVAEYRSHPAMTAFGHFAAAYAPQLERGNRHRLNPLVANYGPALLDRCVLDALGKLLGLSFYRLMQRNLAGINPALVVADLQDFDFDAFLAGLRPQRSLQARHTVGLVDPIANIDLPPENRLNDGLPETLEDVVTTYRQHFFKLKVGGHLVEDVARLKAIAGILDRMQAPYYVTLDGNEQYGDTASVLELWQEIEREPALRRLHASILFIEQPIKRQVAATRDISALAAMRPVIVDESDGDLSAFPRARQLGYAGVSSKNCKGLYKALINRARCELWNRTPGDTRHFMSAEDLTTLAGVAVQQDLALVSLLGLQHVERNGHHFVDGMSGRPPGEQQAFLAAHPGLYQAANGVTRLRIVDGRIDIRSLDCPGLAVAAEPNWSALDPMQPSRWR